MVAEERKRENPKSWKLGRLGKRIKRLGVCNLLYEGREAEQAANFCRGMRYDELDRLCRKYGF